MQDFNEESSLEEVRNKILKECAEDADTLAGVLFSISRMAKVLNLDGYAQIGLKTPKGENPYLAMATAMLQDFKKERHGQEVSH